MIEYELLGFHIVVWIEPEDTGHYPWRFRVIKDCQNKSEADYRGTTFSRSEAESLARRFAIGRYNREKDND
tara:strand:+ start:408 stop:620 length:213 start_codon:yes stop_codon:yes gene_type:complete